MATITKHPTSPFLLTQFEYCMFRWHDQAPDSCPGSIPDDLDTLPFLVYMAYIEQFSIGWDHAIRGRIS
jgi:hypothetical protein